jgi:hypothetical protein
VNSDVFQARHGWRQLVPHCHRLYQIVLELNVVAGQSPPLSTHYALVRAQFRFARLKRDDRRFEILEHRKQSLVAQARPGTRSSALVAVLAPSLRRS